MENSKQFSVNEINNISCIFRNIKTEYKSKEIELAKDLITTVPFGEKNRLPLELLDDAKITYLINPFKKN